MYIKKKEELPLKGGRGFALINRCLLLTHRHTHSHTPLSSAATLPGHALQSGIRPLSSPLLWYSPFYHTSQRAEILLQMVKQTPFI